MALDLERSLAGASLGLLGCGVIVLYTGFNRRARLRGSASHWGTGWLLGFLGMTTLGLGWALLFLAGPRLESGLREILGGALCATSLWIYVLSARHVGRWRRPSRYSLGLCTHGIHGHVRHPQALSLCVLPLGLALVSGSIPFLVTVPLWIAFWTAYTYLEERLELIPAFGEAYLRYRKSTPRLVPRIRPPRRSSDKTQKKRVSAPR